MPQPLSRVHPTAGVILAAGNTPHSPEMASSVLAVINLWAQIEFNYGSLLAVIAKADPVAVTAVYQAIISGDARKAALYGAAKEKLASEDASLIQAVVESSKASRNQRNDFAHHLWGSLNERPECVVLMNPKVAARFTAKMRAYSGKGDLPDFDRDKVLVYTLRDFREAEELARVCHRQTVELSFAMPHHPAADRRRKALLADPKIARLYEHHLRENTR